MTFQLPLPSGMSAATFLSTYWQKKPLLIKSAFPDFVTPLSPEEIAGMACEDGIDARLVIKHDDNSPWQLRHGPFEPAEFTRLPEGHWTVLVQEVHKYVPELAQLLEHFRFIPNWRIDDIMVSYAPINGSVGPHVDQYDVFLLQGLGHKRWHIAHSDAAEAAVIEHQDLRLLAQFEAQESWELEAGDMLYLPPGIAHHGVALDDNITYSIGFRAPAERDLILSFTEFLSTERSADALYVDPDLSVPTHPGEISAAALLKVQHILRQCAPGAQDVALWFGQFITESKHGDEATPREHTLDREGFVQRFERAGGLSRSEFSRFAFVEQDHSVLLFVAGELDSLPARLADAVALICDQRHHVFEQWRPLFADQDAIELLCRLTNQGHFYFDDDAD